MRANRMIFGVMVVVAMLFGAAAAAQAQSGTTLEGVLQIVWGDPPPGGGPGVTFFTLRLVDGSLMPLDMTSVGAEAFHYFNKRVIVSGRAMSGQFATMQGPASVSFAVDSIAPAPAAADAQPPEAAVLGTKKVIFLLLKFSDDNAVPHVPSFYTDLTNPDTPPQGAQFPATINGFFKRTSYNAFSWQADVGGAGGVGAPNGWLTLPQPKSFYANCTSGSCANLNKIGDDGTALGRAAGINLTNYDNINFVVSNDLDCCAYGGGYFDAVDNKNYGATWEPPWGQNTGVYAHEMSHSLGLPHSGWVYYAYDSPWDILSAMAPINSMNCGSYISRNNNNTVRNISCDEPGAAYIAPYKDFVGWIPPANLVTTNANASLIVNLEGLSLALGATAKMIKICLAGSPCTGATARYYTVEARVKGLGATSQFDNGIPGEGIIIHEYKADRAPLQPNQCYFNNQSGWAVPIDSTPGDYNGPPACSFAPGTALFNAQWGVGSTYTNNADGVTVSVLSRNGSTFSVAVGPQGPPPAATLISPAGTTGTATPTYTWNAVAGATWYYLYVSDSSSPSRITQWYTAAQAGCAAGTGTCAVIHSTVLAAGAAQWWIQTYNAAGYGPWSTGLPFTVTAPPAATLITPTGTINTTTPTYTWNAVNGSTWYYLYVSDSGSPSRIAQWYTAAQAGCGAGTGTCSVIPGTALAVGAGQWWIQTYNSAGYGPWSAGMAFTVSPPGQATLISPSGAIGTSTPTYFWQAVPGTVSYYLWVNDVSGIRIQLWYTAAQAGCPNGTGNCGVTPGTAVHGASRFWIQTWSSAGYGPWSNVLNFTAP